MGCLKKARRIDYVYEGVDPVSATDLTASAVAGSHFHITDLTDEDKQNLAEKFVTPLFAQARLTLDDERVSISYHLAKFECDVLESTDSIFDKLENEATLRFSLVDPAVKFIARICPKIKVCTSVYLSVNILSSLFCVYRHV